MSRDAFITDMYGPEGWRDLDSGRADMIVTEHVDAGLRFEATICDAPECGLLAVTGRHRCALPPGHDCPHAGIADFMPQWRFTRVSSIRDAR